MIPVFGTTTWTLSTGLIQKMYEIALHATGHAALCAICQQEVSRILGQDWSPF